MKPMTTESAGQMSAETHDEGRSREFRYAAFISYRQADPDRRWAKWLHTSLESYRIPKRLCIARGLVKNRLAPVFQDEQELSAVPSLTEHIGHALADAEFLIVICSPRSAQSPWVNLEIEQFCRLGRSNKILALLIEGSPEEALPAPLRQPPATQQTDGQPVVGNQVIEMLAADVRPLPGQSGRARRRLAKLRLISTMLGVRLDELRQREQERQLRRLIALSSFLTVLLVVIGLLAITAWYQRNLAVQQTHIAQQRMLDLYEESGRQALLRGDPDSALHSLLEAYRKPVALEPPSPSLRFLLAQAELPSEGFLTAFRGHTSDIVAARWSEDGTRLLTTSSDYTSRLWDSHGHPLGVVRNSYYPQNRTPYAVDKALLHFVTLIQDGSASRVFVHDVATGKDTPLNFDRPSIGMGPYVAAISPDGAHVVTSGGQNTCIWDAVTGMRVGLPLDNSNSPDYVVYSADGTELFGMSYKGFTVWNVQSRERQEIPRPPRTSASLIVGPADAKAAVLIQGAPVQLWTGQKNVSLGVAISSIESSALFTPDGHGLAIVEADGGVLYDTDTGTVRTRLPGAASALKIAGTFSPDGSRLFTPMKQGGLKVWNLKQPDTAEVLNPHTFTTVQTDFSSSGDFVAAVDSDFVRIRNAKTGELINSIAAHGGTFAAFSPKNDDELLIAEQGGALRLWRWSDMRSPLVRSFTHGQAAIQALAWDYGNDRIVTGGTDNLAVIWNVHSGQRLQTLKHGFYVRSASFNRTGTQLLTGSDDGFARLWNPSTGEMIREVKCQGDNVFGPMPVHAAFCPMDDSFLTATADGRIILHDSDNRLRPVKIQSTLISQALFSLDARYIAVAGNRGVELFTTHDATTVELLQHNDGAARTLEFDHTGVCLAAIYADGSVRIWDLHTGAVLPAFQGHLAPTSAACFDPTGKTLALGSVDGSITLWNTRTGKQNGDLKRTVVRDESPNVMQMQISDLGAGLTGAPDAVLWVSFSSDGAFVFAAGRSHTIDIWSAESYKHLASLKGHTLAVTQGVFNADNSLLLTAGDDGTARLWDIHLERRDVGALDKILASRALLP
jgi:WD40 repeat protein